MGIFKNLFKKQEEKDLAAANQKDRDLVEKNCKMIDSLIVLAEDNDEFVDELKKLKNEMNFLTWSIKEEVYEHDKKIEQAIEVLKKELVENCDDKAKSLLRNLKMIVAERKALV